tara:strand:- start:827 stop:3502 length:2676 start_codon:yes stop_codon:yes gene_type:complete
LEVIISPEKNLYISPETLDRNDEQFVVFFNKDYANGLLHLVKYPEIRKKSTSISFWYEFGSEVLRNFCTITENSDLSVTPDDELIRKYLNFSPNFLGREYLDYELLRSLWERLNVLLRSGIKDCNNSFRQFIESNYPEWAQVGRINFHLAETKKQDNLPFAFLATYTTRISNKARIQHIPLGRIILEYADKKKKNLLLSVLKPIKEAASSSNFINNLVTSKRIYQTSYLNSLQAYEFLNSTNACEKAGIVIKLPQSWHGKRPSRVKVSIKIGEDKKPSFVGFNSLFKFQVNVTIDGKILGQKEIETLLTQNQQFVEIRGKWVEVNKSKLESLLEKWHKASFLQKDGVTFSEAMRMLSNSNITRQDNNILGSEATNNSWLEFTSTKQLNDVLDGMLNPSSLISKEMTLILKMGLKATLRPYQEDGVKWLTFISKLGLGGCLADDMGLGKTIQIVSLLLIEKKMNNRFPNLLVVPSSLLGNWENELNKFAPSLTFKILHGSRMSKSEITSFNKCYMNVDIVITTYNLSKKIGWLKEKNWNIFILDEAQAIKNPNSQQTKSIKEIPSRVKITMTGTPIENSATDLWSLFDFSCPSLLGTHAEFKKFQKNMYDDFSCNSLRELVQPYIIRRKKTDPSVISDLPDKTELQTYCLLTQEQIKLYKQTIDELSKDLANNEKSKIQRKGLILSYLLKFKQLCNHPSQLLSDNIYDYKKSGKFYRLRELADTIASRGEKVLIFTQFREITDILNVFLSEIFSRKGFVLHGGTPVQKRKKMVDDFQKESSAPYFILSLKAGGTGLNLTKASHVIHFDRWWNPAVENQATDRAFRIGQKKNVVVHKFICRGTIEERINLMLEDKKILAENIIESNKEIKLTELSNDEILKLVSLNFKSAEIN